VLCSRVFRSSVLSNIPLTEQGKEDGIRAVAVLTAELVRLVGGRSQRARAVRASVLDGVWS